MAQYTVRFTQVIRLTVARDDDREGRWRPRTVTVSQPTIPPSFERYLAQAAATALAHGRTYTLRHAKRCWRVTLPDAAPAAPPDPVPPARPVASSPPSVPSVP